MENIGDQRPRSERKGLNKDLVSEESQQSGYTSSKSLDSMKDEFIVKTHEINQSQRVNSGPLKEAMKGQVMTR